MFWDDLVWGAGDVLTNLKWMLFTMLAPEIILGKAIGDFRYAWKLKKDMEYFAVKDNVDWGLSHGFFAIMGGFRVIGQEENQKQQNSKRHYAQQQGDRQQDTRQQNAQGEDIHGGEKMQVTEHHGEIADLAIEPDHKLSEQPPIAGNADAFSEVYEYRVIKRDHKLSEQPPIAGNAEASEVFEIDGQDIVNSYILSGEDILYLRKRGIIKRLPCITTAEIHDKGKANVFVKAIAVIQVFWISLQVVVRSIRGLAISQLELVVTAYSLCAIITYAFLIPKPQGVQVPKRPIKLDSRLYHIRNTDTYAALRVLFINKKLTSENNVELPPMARVENDFVYGKDILPYALGIWLGGIVFGAVHVAGWNLNFPTAVERELWRISSLIMIGLLPIPLLPLFIVAAGPRFDIPLDCLPKAIEPLVIPLWGSVFGMFYILARLYLLVETFRTLVFLPPDAFISTWVSNIPNVS